MLALRTLFHIVACGWKCKEEEEDEDSDDEDDTAELLAELQKIKKERAVENAKKV